jgi:hypothetical protein
MKDIGIDKREGTVVFGQVDGMGDQVSYGLGKYYNFKGYLCPENHCTDHKL